MLCHFFAVQGEMQSAQLELKAGELTDNLCNWVTTERAHCRGGRCDLSALLGRSWEGIVVIHGSDSWTTKAAFVRAMDFSEIHGLRKQLSHAEPILATCIPLHSRIISLNDRIITFDVQLLHTPPVRRLFAVQIRVIRDLGSPTLDYLLLWSLSSVEVFTSFS